MFGEEVAKVFGRLEVVRTGMNGVARAVGKPRNSKAVRTAIAYVEAGGSLADQRRIFASMESSNDGESESGSESESDN